MATLLDRGYIPDQAHVAPSSTLQLFVQRLFCSTSEIIEYIHLSLKKSEVRVQVSSRPCMQMAHPLMYDEGKQHTLSP